MTDSTESVKGIVFPAEIADLLYEIDAVPQTLVDDISKTLPPKRPSDIVKGVLPPFAQKMIALGLKKQVEADEAQEAGDEETDIRLAAIQMALQGLIDLMITSVLTADELCDDRYSWKIRRGYVLIFYTAEEDEEEEVNDDSGFDEPPRAPVRDKKKMH